MKNLEESERIELPRDSRLVDCFQDSSITALPTLQTPVMGLWRKVKDSNLGTPQGLPVSNRAHSSTLPTFHLVPKEGLEPPRRAGQRFLRPPRLPFRHFGIWCSLRDSNPLPFPEPGYSRPRLAICAETTQKALALPPGSKKIFSLHDVQVKNLRAELASIFESHQGQSPLPLRKSLARQSLASGDLGGSGTRSHL